MTALQHHLIQQVLQDEQRVSLAMRQLSSTEWMHLDLSMSQVKALFALANEDTLTISQLADMLAIGKSAGSILVDRLVQLGLVDRTEDQQDRRRSNVVLSESGRALTSRLIEGRRELLRTWLSRLAPEELSALATGMRALAELTYQSDAVTPVVDHAG